MPSYTVLGSMVFELHDLRIVSFLEVVTPSWVTKTESFTLVIDYPRYCCSFEVLQAKVKYHLSVGPARPSRMPSTNNTPRLMDRLLYLSCILLRVGR